MKDDNLEENLRKMFEILSEKVDFYDINSKFLFDAEEIMKTVFRNYFEAVEGSMCCYDKASYVVRTIQKSLNERKNLALTESYAEYQRRGGDLGGLNASNCDLNERCFWCPKTIKDTKQAIDLFYGLINVGSIARKTKDQEWKNKLLETALDLALEKMEERLDYEKYYGVPDKKDLLIEAEERLKSKEGV